MLDLTGHWRVKQHLENGDRVFVGEKKNLFVFESIAYIGYCEKGLLLKTIAKVKINALTPWRNTVRNINYFCMSDPWKRKSRLRISLSIYVVLTLEVSASQNGQTHSNNSSAFAEGLFECVWPFCEVAASSVEAYNLCFKLQKKWKRFQKFLLEYYHSIC